MDYVKSTSGTDGWLIYDSQQDLEPRDNDLLYADTDQAENPLPPRVLFLI